MPTEIGMIAADTSRTRAYLAALERHDLLPAFVVLLNALQAKPGQADASAPRQPHPLTQGDWTETDFDPAAPLKPWLERAGVPFAVSDNDVDDFAIKELIEKSAPSVFIYSGFGGVLLGKDILSCGKRFLHVHGGYLPDFKGSTTNYFSLLEENALGASAIFLTAEIDSGPILARRRFPPPPERESIDHVYDSAARARVLIDVLQAYRQRGEWPSEPVQNKIGETYYIIHPVLKHLAILGKDAE